MKFLRLLVIGALAVLLLAGAWIWWVQPSAIDMADYAPADSVVYVQFDSAPKVVEALEQSDTWKAIAPALGLPANGTNWRSTFIRAGIGPAGAVIFSRAQLALVVVGVNQTQTEDTLRIKPEVALIAETHTSRWRLKPVVTQAIQQLANFAYGHSTCTERGGDPELFECTSGVGDRKIIAAIDGSLAVIGNTDKAIQSCLEVRRGLRPSLHTDGEMLRVRSSLTNEKALGFGYVSASNAARLFSWLAPLVMGKPGDEQLGRMFEASAGKILRGIAWTSSPSQGGIEDRMVISLEPSVASRLEPAFNARAPDDSFWKLVPISFQSITIYSSSDPVAAWTALDSAVALKLDAVSAVLFSSLLRSSLALYGVNDPKELLSSLTPPLLTLKPSPEAAGSVLLAAIGDRERLRRNLMEVLKGSEVQILEGMPVKPIPEKEFTALFLNNYLVLGKTENVRLYLQALGAGPTSDGTRERFRHFAPQSTSAIVTYADDEQRLNSFISLVALLRRSTAAPERLKALQNADGYWNFSATETSLNSAGIERKTRSAFGQFSTLLSLLQQDSSAAVR